MELRPNDQANLGAHRRRSKQPMIQNIISSQVNKKICEAFDCAEEATVEIEVQVGDKGLSLDLCEECAHNPSNITT